MSAAAVMILAIILFSAAFVIALVGAVLWIDERRSKRVRVTENPFGDRPLPPAYCSCAAMKEACDCRSLERAARSMCA